MANVLAGLNFGVALFELFLANYTFYHHRASRLARLAAGRSLAVSLFAIASGFFYLAPSFEAANFWNRARIFPFILLPVLTLQISLLFFQSSGRSISRIAVAGGYATAGLLFISGFFLNLWGNPLRDNNGAWIVISGAQDLWPAVFAAWCFTLVTISILLGLFALPEKIKAGVQSNDWQMMAALAFPTLAALIVLILPTNIIPEFLALASLFVFISDGLIARGLHEDRPPVTEIIQAREDPSKLEQQIALITSQAQKDLADRDQQLVTLNRAKAALEKKLDQQEREESNWRRQLSGLQSIFTLSSALRKARTIPEMITILLEEVTRSLSASGGACLLLNGSTLNVISQTGVLEDLKGYNHPFGTDLLWEVIEQNQPRFYSDKEQVTHIKPLPAFISSNGEVCVLPLKTTEKQLGLLLLTSEISFQRSEIDLGILSTVSEIASNALYRASLQDTLELQVQTRTRDLHVLYSISAIPSQATSLEDILERSLALLLNSLSGLAGVIYLSGAEGSLQILTRADNQFPNLKEKLTGIALENSIWRSITQKNQPVYAQSIVNDVRIDYHIVNDLVPLEECSLIGSPIRGPQETLGAVCLFRSPGSAFNREDLSLLAAVSDQLEIVIENVRLHRREEQNAVSEERRRLGRDLHDSISRLLESQLEVINSAIAQEDVENQAGGRATLEQIRLHTSQAIKEMRLLIFDLSPSSLENRGLYKALEHRLETVERRAGLKSELSGEYSFRLPGVMERDFYRIALDVLNHSLKHTRADCIKVRLISDYDHINLEIAAKGGIEKDSLSQNMEYINSLRQQVERLGGQLTMHTEPDDLLIYKIALQAK